MLEEPAVVESEPELEKCTIEDFNDIERSQLDPDGELMRPAKSGLKWADEGSHCQGAVQELPHRGRAASMGRRENLEEVQTFSKFDHPSEVEKGAAQVITCTCRGHRYSAYAHPPRFSMHSITQARPSAKDAKEEAFVEIDSDGEEIDPDDVAPELDLPALKLAEEVARGMEAIQSQTTQFIPASGWIGVYEGMFFGTGDQGTGYYGEGYTGAKGATAAASPVPAADSAVRVAISEDSDSDSDDDSDDTVPLDEELLADLDRNPDDSTTAEGLSGWFSEQVATFRYNEKFRTRMLGKYGSAGDFQLAVGAIVDQRAKRLKAEVRY
jgi:hypothetical protein